MLELRKISKIYETGETQQKALDEVSVRFRANEFVSILGQSGSGKTTLLNMIGGLDQPTSGEILINGQSTRDFTDRDWDTYRNHSVGFVFQSYNLISHQTVLANVELALTLTGQKKQERQARAQEALEKVGLGDHLHKRPSQLSGGQMQRVAIARALVNDPEILLADEPTGALDSETSTQIMDLLEEIALDRLVIMVTHNPELAEKYSTRLIELADGQVIADSQPFEVTESQAEKLEQGQKTRMSFWTALGLSFNNLLTKKGRTLLTAFAGSIGIIGIALILSLSNGVSHYIDQIQEDTMTSYPLTIQKTKDNMLQTFEQFQKREEPKHKKDEIVAQKRLLSVLDANQEKNDLEAFSAYIKENQSAFEAVTNSIQKHYDFDLLVYSNPNNKQQFFQQVNPSPVTSAMGLSERQKQMNASSSLFNMNNWQPLVDNLPLLKQQHKILAGRLPEKPEEVVLMVDNKGKIDDMTLYALGLADADHLKQVLQEREQDKQKGEAESSYETYPLDDLLNLDFTILPNALQYEKKEGHWEKRTEQKDFLKKQLKKGLPVKIVGVLQADSQAEDFGSSSAIGYLPALEEKIIAMNQDSELVKAQKKDPKKNILTGVPFGQKLEDLQGKMSPAELKKMAPEQLEALSQAAEQTYEGNLQAFGALDTEHPDSLAFYTKSFEDKEKLKDLIAHYNEGKKEGEEIQYSDEIGLLLSAVTSIIDMITTVLIGFVTISLVVSSIMIGIITYISVLERTKEIGILRSIGASKGDISRVFNAETFIQGLAAGGLGIVVTIGLDQILNYFINQYLGISGFAFLAWPAAVILILVSVALTLLAGIIPARIAAKKDPIEALRTE